MIIQIAKAELRNLFYSPVAWFLILVFLVQCAYFFSDALVNAATLQDVMLKNNPSYPGATRSGLTRGLFLGGGGVFTNILKNLYLFIPLLTMGLIGREVQNGTFRLLYSSPVKLHQIVMGKYLAIMVYNLLLLLIIGVFMVTASFSVVQEDYGMLLSAALGFYLLTCAYTAIGTFMSSLTTHQIIAAVSTFLIVLCLSFIGGMWQKYDFVRDLTYFLHLPGRAEKMLLGLITTKDVVYFIVIVMLFLGFTILRLRAARDSKPWYVSVLRYSAVVVIGLMIGYISSRPTLTVYWDTTAQKLNTLHPKTQQLIKAMGEEPLEVTLYSNLLGFGHGAGLPEARNAYLTRVWEKYLRFKPDIKFNYVYYYDHDSAIMGNSIYRTYRGKSLDHIASKIAAYGEQDTADYLKPSQIRKLIDLRPENLQLVMQLKYKGRTAFLRVYPDPEFWPSEYNTAAVLKKLVQDNTPKVAFVTGHFERNIYKTGEREYAFHTASKVARRALNNLGFAVDTINLDTENIPSGLNNLVLADPKSELSAICLEKISRYIGNGGNMFIMGEPGKQQILNPVLKQLGVKLMDGILVSQWKEEMPDMQVTHATEAYRRIVKELTDQSLKKNDLEAVLSMQHTTAIDYTDTAGFINTPLFTTTPGESWLKKGKLVADSAMVAFNKAEGDVPAFLKSVNNTRSIPVQLQTVNLVQQTDSSLHATNELNSLNGDGSFVTILALNRKFNSKDQRIIVFGDADFMRNKRESNHERGRFLYSWLTNGEYPIYLPRPLPLDKFLSITTKTAKMLRLIYVWIFPGLVLLAGTILLVRRKRK